MNKQKNPTLIGGLVAAILGSIRSIRSIWPKRSPREKLENEYAEAVRDYRRGKSDMTLEKLKEIQKLINYEL